MAAGTAMAAGAEEPGPVLATVPIPIDYLQEFVHRLVEEGDGAWVRKVAPLLGLHINATCGDHGTLLAQAVKMSSVDCVAAIMEQPALHTETCRNAHRVAKDLDRGGRAVVTRRSSMSESRERTSDNEIIRMLKLRLGKHQEDSTGVAHNMSALPTEDDAATLARTLCDMHGIRKRMPDIELGARNMHRQVRAEGPVNLFLLVSGLNTLRVACLDTMVCTALPANTDIVRILELPAQPNWVNWVEMIAVADGKSVDHCEFRVVDGATPLRVCPGAIIIIELFHRVEKYFYSSIPASYTPYSVTFIPVATE